MDIKITKTNDEQMEVSGWAYVSSVSGALSPDHSGDTITIEELKKAAFGYLTKSRAGKAQHQGKVVAILVNSIVLSTDIQKSLGIDLDKEGWFVTFKIHDEQVWDKIKSGEYEAFSIGGTAQGETNAST